MSILHSHSLIFNVKTTVKSYSFTSFLPSSSISRYRFRKLSKFSIHSSFSSFNDPRDFFVPKPPGNKHNQNEGDSDDKPVSFVDEWGERTEPELRPLTKLSESDPPIDVDEWGRAELGSTNSSGVEDEWGEKSYPELRPAKTLSDSDPPIDEDEWIGAKLRKLVGNNTDRVRIWGISKNKTTSFVDEWGEKSETEPEPEPMTKLSESDPPKDEDEWGGTEPVTVEDEGVPDDKPTSFVGEWDENSEPEPQPVARLSDSLLGEAELVGKITAGVVEDERVVELKRCLIDAVYGTDFGLRASLEVRAEALELVAQLEAANPTPNPVESPELLDGNWILVFTAFSELLPLLAVGTIPLLKVEKISQAISTSSLTIENSTTLSSPVATLSFSATAAFEVRSPSRIQIEFKEGSFKPPEIKSKIDLPENVYIFGQNISLSPVQQSLGPLENAVAGIAQTISGLPPLKVPIPGERTKSWLIMTYLDKDLRISRGDGGLFVLVKEESSLPDQ